MVSRIRFVYWSYFIAPHLRATLIIIAFFLSLSQ